MRGVIVTDKDFRTLLRELDLEMYYRGGGRPIPPTSDNRGPLVNEVHAWFRFIVTKWMEDISGDSFRARSDRIDP